jgi:hypothetical protein
MMCPADHLDTEVASLSRSPDRWILLLVVAALLPAATITLFIDVLGSDDWLEGRLVPLFWYHIFLEKGPIETMQWFFLGVSILACGALWGHTVAARTGARAAYRFNSPETGWFLLGSGFVLLILEDAGNIRHEARAQVVKILGTDANTTALVVELTFYTGFSLVMLSGLLLTWRQWRLQGGAWKRLLLGFFAYGVAGFSSASRNVSGWYERVGLAMIEQFGVAQDVRWQQAAETVGGMPALGFYLMDLALEESLELLAAGFLLSALVHELVRQRSVAHQG